MGLITILVSLNVFLRWVIHDEIAWVLEVTEYALAFIPALAGAYVLKVEQHIVIDTLLHIFSPKNRSILKGLMSIIGAVVCAVFCIGSALLTHEEFVNGIIMVDKTLQIPRCYLVAILPVGLFMISIQFLLRAYGFFRER
ncbi:MAG: TRAP transporter small permease [Desulfobacteraceae bacterium]|jgi:TRAP-type C4-dicarboxylate transport system permease small subunit